MVDNRVRELLTQQSSHNNAYSRRKGKRKRSSHCKFSAEESANAASECGR